MSKITLEGRRVRICSNDKYAVALEGTLGVVECVFRSPEYPYNKTLGIRIDNSTNSDVPSGLFWLKPYEVEFIDNCEENVKYESEETTTMLKGFKVAGISFLEDSNTEMIYAYALYDDNIEVNDIVVVQSGHHGIGIARVVRIDGEDAAGLVQDDREVIAKVDFTAFNERKEKAAKMEKLKKEMDRKVKELQSFAIYEMLAEKDPSLKEMLDEFKSLAD